MSDVPPGAQPLEGLPSSDAASVASRPEVTAAGASVASGPSAGPPSPALPNGPVPELFVPQGQPPTVAGVKRKSRSPPESPRLRPPPSSVLTSAPAPWDQAAPAPSSPGNGEPSAPALATMRSKASLANLLSDSDLPPPPALPPSLPQPILDPQSVPPTASTPAAPTSPPRTEAPVQAQPPLLVPSLAAPTSLQSLLATRDPPGLAPPAGPPAPLDAGSAQWPPPAPASLPKIEQVSALEESDAGRVQGGALAEVDDVENDGEPVDDGIIRCLCEINTDDGFTIQCEVCEVWQHGICVGIAPGDEVPEVYYCDQCEPQMSKRRALAARRPIALQLQRERLLREREHLARQRAAAEYANALGLGGNAAGSYDGARADVGGARDDEGYREREASIGMAAGSPSAPRPRSASASAKGGRSKEHQGSPAYSHASVSANQAPATVDSRADSAKGGKKKRSSLPKQASPAAGLGAATDGGASGGRTDASSMPAPKEVPLRASRGAGGAGKKPKPRSRASMADQEVRSMVGATAASSAAAGVYGPGIMPMPGFPPGLVGTPTEMDDLDERYEPWRYEYTPISKDRYSDPVARAAVVAAVYDFLEANLEDAELGRGKRMPRQRPTSDDAAPTLPLPNNPKEAATSHLKSFVTPLEVSKLPSGARLQIKPLASTSITLAPSFAVPFSTPTVPITGLCPYPRSTIHGVFSTAPIPAGNFITLLRGDVVSLESYRADPLSQYDELGVPKPGVRAVAAPFCVAVDSRQWGNEARYIRSGCHPNAVVVPIIAPDDAADWKVLSEAVDKVKTPGEPTLEAMAQKKGRYDLDLPSGDVAFAVFASSDIGRRDEIVLPWDWDDRHTVHLLPALLRAASTSTDSWPLEAIHLLTRKMANISNVLLGIASCACEKKKDCAVALMWKLAGLTEKTSVNKGAKGPFGDRLKAALLAAAEPGARGKAAKRKQKVDLGPLLGLKRLWFGEDEVVDSTRASTPAIGESTAATREPSRRPSVDAEDKSSPRPDTSPPNDVASAPIPTNIERKPSPPVLPELAVVREDAMDVDEIKATSEAFDSGDMSDSDASTVIAGQREDDIPLIGRRSRAATPTSLSAIAAVETVQGHSGPNGIPTIPMDIVNSGPQPAGEEDPGTAIPADVKVEDVEPVTDLPSRAPPRRISLKDFMRRRGTAGDVALPATVEEPEGDFATAAPPQDRDKSAPLRRMPLNPLPNNAAGTISMNAREESAPLSETYSPAMGSPVANSDIELQAAGPSASVRDSPHDNTSNTMVSPEQVRPDLANMTHSAAGSADQQQPISDPVRSQPPKSKLSLADYMKRRPTALEAQDGAEEPPMPAAITPLEPSSEPVGALSASQPPSPPAAEAPLPSPTTGLAHVQPGLLATNTPHTAKDPPSGPSSAHFRFPSFSSALGLVAESFARPRSVSPPVRIVPGAQSSLAPSAEIREGPKRSRSRTPPEPPPDMPSPAMAFGIERSHEPVSASSQLSLSRGPLSRFESPSTRDIPTGPRALTSPQTTMPGGFRGQRPMANTRGGGAFVAGHREAPRGSASTSRPASPRIPGTPTAPLLQDRIKPAPSIPASPVIESTPHERPLPVGPSGQGRGAIAPPRAPRAFQNLPPAQSKFRASWPPAPPSGPWPGQSSGSEQKPPTAPGVPTGPSGRQAAPTERARYDGIPRGPAAMTGGPPPFPGRGRARVRGGGMWGGRGRGRGY